RQDDEVNEEESDEESDDESNEDSNEEVQGANTKEEEMDEEAIHEEDEANELYRDVNINLEGRDTVMIDAPLPNVQGTQVMEDTHLIITTPINHEGQQQSSSVLYGFVSNMLNPSPDTGIDTIFTPNTETTSLVDVLITTIAEPLLLSAKLFHPLLSLHICNKHQYPRQQLFQAPHYKIFPTLALYLVSSILGIVDAYLANKMHEAVKTADQVKEQVKAQVSKILPKIEKTVNEQLEAEVMTRSSTESKTSLAIAANLSELELKKILIEKMESNKLIYRSDEQKNLYKALVNAYESNKLILDTYGDTVSFKRRRDDKDKDEEPFAGSNRGSKRRRAGKEPESTKEPMHTTKDLEELAHQEFETGVTEDQHNKETTKYPDWFQKPTKLPSPDRDWNKTLPDAHGPVQPW
ncbi:hypothetical protein Tco_1550825, partial [Tanacetum coccineum]